MIFVNLSKKFLLKKFSSSALWSNLEREVDIVELEKIKFKEKILKEGIFEKFKKIWKIKTLKKVLLINFIIYMCL
ncbi:MAG: hypothetical protein C0169_02480 [Thermodesulfobacterium geofontis]|uniref:Uncharacterized protein n=1 Tax=Thermodesulfobacterium geofontis TaxID=1295609 RepID=A0A2N7QFK6_9BACT|nr:MAG: hypothetical protein C0169_02480 [Thermodesulfobacterium geofontis]